MEVAGREMGGGTGGRRQEEGEGGGQGRRQEEEANGQEEEGGEGTGGKRERGNRGTVYIHKNVLSVKSHDGHKTSPKFEKRKRGRRKKKHAVLSKSHDLTCTCPLYLPAIGTPVEVPEHTTTFFCTPQCCNLQEKQNQTIQFTDQLKILH